MVPKPNPALDWAALPAGSTVVDVGGGSGKACFPIAKAYPHLKVVIQDKPHVVAKSVKVISDVSTVMKTFSHVVLV